MNTQLPLFRLSKLLILIIVLGSCKPTSPEFELSPIQLRFSTDTVYFDTLLSTVTSITKRLRVYNDAAKAVTISHIGITNTSNAYTLILNGIEGNGFENTALFAGDSLLILLKANLQEQNQNLPFVVEEALSFVTNGAEQQVPVIAWGQDANFLRDSVLICNTVWTAGKPYVIYDNILVDSLCTLIIEPGTRVFSHIGSAIYIKGSIISKGNATNSVLFTNDRFDNGFDNAPGQWAGIVFLEGSKSNVLNFTHIRNAQNGIWLGTPDEDDIPDLVMNNSIIENTSGSGILAFSSDLTLTNCLINNCVEFNVAGLAGGNYNFKHNTFANFGFGFFRNSPIMVFTNNLQLGDGSVIYADLNARVENSIIWGNQNEELQFSNAGGKLFNVTIKNNLLRTTLPEMEAENILNKTPLFTEPSAYNYKIDTLSPAIDVGINLGVLIDLDSTIRDLKPDIGAYEWNQN
ncbi:MAG: right-handed parallel beta-helix repeat-containing protein [Cyclobacteriaceae bacterium]|nr:right-handed parallel beta-helix repeat-containing protein [Cyclobacteriaceae bacterium]